MTYALGSCTTIPAAIVHEESTKGPCPSAWSAADEGRQRYDGPGPTLFVNVHGSPVARSKKSRKTSCPPTIHLRARKRPPLSISRLARAEGSAATPVSHATSTSARSARRISTTELLRLLNLLAPFDARRIVTALARAVRRAAALLLALRIALALHRIFLRRLLRGGTGSRSEHERDDDGRSGPLDRLHGYLIVPEPAGG